MYFLRKRDDFSCYVFADVVMVEPHAFVASLNLLRIRWGKRNLVCTDINPFLALVSSTYYVGILCVAILQQRMFYGTRATFSTSAITTFFNEYLLTM